MLYLEDLKVGDRFISRDYEMTLEEITQFAHFTILSLFISMKKLHRSIPSFRVWQPVVGTPLQW